MYTKIPRHSGGLNVVRDVVLALGGKRAGRHAAKRLTEGPTFVQLLGPVVPDPTFPGFELPAVTK